MFVIAVNLCGLVDGIQSSGRQVIVVSPAHKPGSNTWFYGGGKRQKSARKHDNTCVCVDQEASPPPPPPLPGFAPSPALPSTPLPSYFSLPLASATPLRGSPLVVTNIVLLRLLPWYCTRKMNKNDQKSYHEHHHHHHQACSPAPQSTRVTSWFGSSLDGTIPPRVPSLVAYIVLHWCRGERKGGKTVYNHEHHHHCRRQRRWHQAPRLAPLRIQPLFLLASSPRWLALSLPVARPLC